MQARKLQVKIYAADGPAMPLERFVPIFHAWIRDRALDELVIDVADYSHVHHGPGILLVGHESDYCIDESDGRRGLMYSRKRLGPESPRDCLQDAFRRAVNACSLLAKEPSLQGQLAFVGGEALVRVNDRLLGPNTDRAFEELSAELGPLCRQLYGADPTISRAGEERDLLTARIVAEKPVELATLLRRLGGPLAA